jgi:hypothetical protein
LDIVIIHLKTLGSDDLEPVDYTFRASERVQMGIRG